MKDYYLKAESKEAVLTELNIEMESDYYQNENYIIDWIGKIPHIIDDEVVSYSDKDRFNVRVINPEFETTIENLQSATNVTPEVPYRIFG